MFVSAFRDLHALERISKKSDLQSAIRGCGSITNIETFWETNLNKFIAEYTDCIKYVLDANTDEEHGGTLGEISLTYYKYNLSKDNPAEIICIDQPEDNISNNRINNKLMKYFNMLRKDKQIFIVTHNPLLIVNLDVDNVIRVDLKNSKLSCVYGCLEDEVSKTLEYVAEKMDGGRESVERRYKLYG